MKKRKLLLSAISLLLVFGLLAGGTMAWFADTEKVGGDFSAGVLDITLTPGEMTSVPLTFKNLRPMRYDDFKAEINPAGNGNLHTESGIYAPVPQYFQPVVIKNAGTLPVYLEVSTEALDMTSVKCPSGGEEKITLGETGNPDKVAWDKTGKDGSCTNGLVKVLHIVLFEKIDGGWTVVADNLNSESAGKPYAPGVIIPATTGEKTYVVGAYLPEATNNAFQGKHFHGNLVVNAYQTDKGAGAPVVPEHNVVEVKDAEGLQQLAGAVNAGAAEQKVYRLTEDIHLKGEWTPIGTEEHPFTGTFDGNGHVITGLKITQPGSYRGMFGEIDGGTVRNVVLKEVNIKFGNQKKNWIGSLAGSLEKGGVIENCTVEGIVNARGYDNMLVGGIVGTVENGKVTGCSFSGKVTGNQYVGGITGRVMSGSVENCWAMGDVEGDYSGGIAGTVTQNGSVKDCWSANEIYNASGTASGGIVGNVSGGRVEGCTALNAEIWTPIGYYKQLGRIAGKQNNASLSGNYAWADMAVNSDFTTPAPLPEETKVPDGVNGGSLAVKNGSLMNGANAYAGPQPKELPDYMLTT